jgi:phage baseplate assembly protein W
MTNFLVPFSLTPTGSVATTDDPSVIAQQRVESLLGTAKGVRVMLPDYGVNLPQYLFEADVDQVSNEITLDVRSQLNKWEPTIQVTNIIPDIDQQSVGIVNVEIDYQIATTNPQAQVFTATVLVGGNVVNN